MPIYKINFTICWDSILAKLIILFWYGHGSFLILEIIKHLFTETKRITADWGPIHVLVDHSILTVRCENLFILGHEHIRQLLCSWLALSSNISLCTWIERLRKSNISSVTHFNSLRPICDLNCALVYGCQIRSMGSIWWLWSLWLVFEGIIDKWFYNGIVLIKLGDSFLLRYGVFKCAYGIELAHCLFV